MASTKETALRTVDQQFERLYSLLSILACPVCGGQLHIMSTDLVCQLCEAHYPIVDGVPVLLPPEMIEQGLGGQLGHEDNISMHPYSDASNQIIYSSENGWILDLGAGGKHVAHRSVVQLDVFRFPMTDVVGSADCLPFQSNSFRAVVSQAVFEHLQYPESAASEVWRVLCPGGVAKIDTAFLQPEHAYPHHYFNATEAGLRHWFRDFEIEWSGVEPYQHPKWSLVWFLSVYLAGLPDAQRRTLEPIGLGACLDVLSRLSRGVSTAEDLPVINALDGLNLKDVRALAAGVAVRAIKRETDTIVPRKNNRETVTSNSAFLAVERRLEKLKRERQMAADHLNASSQIQVVIEDRSRYLLHAHKLLHAQNLAISRNELSTSQTSIGTFMRESLKRLLHIRSLNRTTRHIQLPLNAMLAGGGQANKREKTDEQAAEVTFVVSPQHLIEMLDQFFSLTHQTYSGWELLICLGSDCPDYVRQCAKDLSNLDSRVRLLRDISTLDRTDIKGGRLVLLTPNAVLDFDAVLELVSLGRYVSQLPIISDVDHFGAGAFVTEPMRCYGYVPDGVACIEWYDLAWCGQWLNSVQPLVAYPLFVSGSIHVGDVSHLRPAHIPKSLFRVQSLPVA